jgi:putative transposase
VFEDADDRDLFLELAWRTVERHSWGCFALCVLGTHYHAVVEASTKQLSAGLHRLNWMYARAFNEKRGSFGHVFAGRYSVRAIQREEYLFEVCSYVVLNPVRARLCERVEEWPWSYSAYGLAAS